MLTAARNAAPEIRAAQCLRIARRDQGLCQEPGLGREPLQRRRRRRAALAHVEPNPCWRTGDEAHGAPRLDVIAGQPATAGPAAPVELRVHDRALLPQFVAEWRQPRRSARSRRAPDRRWSQRQWQRTPSRVQSRACPSRSIADTARRRQRGQRGQRLRAVGKPHPARGKPACAGLRRRPRSAPVGQLLAPNVASLDTHKRRALDQPWLVWRACRQPGGSPAHGVQLTAKVCRRRQQCLPQQRSAIGAERGQPSCKHPLRAARAGGHATLQWQHARQALRHRRAVKVFPAPKDATLTTSGPQVAQCCLRSVDADLYSQAGCYEHPSRAARAAGGSPAALRYTAPPVCLAPAVWPRTHTQPSSILCTGTAVASAYSCTAVAPQAQRYGDTKV